MSRGPHWELGARIHAARARRGFNHSALAACCGVSELAVRNWESGISKPKEDRLLKIAEALGVWPQHLVEGGEMWDLALLRVQRVSSPAAFQWPTQYHDELRSNDDDGAEPFRAPLGVAEPMASPERRRARVILASTKIERAQRRPLPPRRCSLCGTAVSVLFGMCTPCLLAPSRDRR